MICMDHRTTKTVEGGASCADLRLASGVLALALALVPGCSPRTVNPGGQQDGAPVDTTPTITREIGKCCADTEDCADRLCIAFLGAGKQWVCGKLCFSNADCPAKSGCQRIGDGKGGFYSVCLPCEIVANTNPRYCPMDADTFKCWK